MLKCSNLEIHRNLKFGKLKISLAHEKEQLGNTLHSSSASVPAMLFRFLPTFQINTSDQGPHDEDFHLEKIVQMDTQCGRPR